MDKHGQENKVYRKMEKTNTIPEKGK